MAKFVARARAIDLLGRQQIAGVPTAINELFKNAHDAYADHVEVDFFRKKKLLVLRDDGVGMSLDDFENRWLVLGTESKFPNRKTPPPAIDPDKDERPIMGEKGIGRLAIASVGKQVLIVSRAKREHVLGKFVVAFINWGIFELPELNLDQVVIPVEEFDEDAPPTVEDIKRMKQEVIDSISVLQSNDDITVSELNKLIAEIDTFDVDPIQLMSSLPGNLSLEDNSGTHFYVSPTDESLISSIGTDGELREEASGLEKMLIGFTNTVTPNHPIPNIQTSFRDYRSDDGAYFDLIGDQSFITPEDFQRIDHHFSGEFDEYGQFKGEVRVYNHLFENHTILWEGNGFRQTLCGKFSIECAYLQGDQKQSYLDQTLYAPVKTKLDRYGGLYIYKDGIRILPYGDNNYDFLDIEKNRSKSASYYFFSYRRMIGVINISKLGNPNLTEKAGREGFIENKAYRQLRDILKNFFVQLAYDFFREKGGGQSTEVFLTLRREREKIHKAKEARDKRARERKGVFVNELNKFFGDVQSGKIWGDIDLLLADTDKRLSGVSSIEDPDEAGQAVIDIEFGARKALMEIRSRYRVSTPRGFSLSKDQRRDWEAYLEEFDKINSDTFRKADNNIDSLVDQYQKVLQIEISRRKRIEKHVEVISEEAKDSTKKKYDEARNVADEVSSRVKKLTQELMENLEQTIRLTKVGLTQVRLSDSADQDIYEQIRSMEAPIIEEKDYATGVLESIIHQLDSIYWEKDGDGRIITNAQISDVLEEELEEAKEKILSDVELTQLGLAVNIVHHEFNSTVNSLRSGIRDLKRWADVDEKLETTYRNIRANFEHLDSYLSLLTPFNRRLYRREEVIKAEEIYIFLLDVFRGRLDRHDIKITRTNGFQRAILKGYRSQFYPVFVNVVDNAIHWLKHKKEPGDKIIRLHSDNGSFYISNNGPEIPINDKENIFDFSFSRKENGRGIGLYISKEVLRNAGYDIFVGEPRKDSTVTFEIKPIKPI
ncbi:ATP-binding protein [Chitinophaga filiformis]|uniref:ATP-binding protein n=1 Tax=Chitinophaga filiformis TaxID=104663 RepID=A0ABY4ICF1_CHIFI|nr:ATP-binding protein [Chitinophaga filiformis]UPK72461.1 ATP-binding protein [Chitinophaga filiformis]